jgi:WD40 repeat protein
MTPERLEELLRTRPSAQRTYNRAFPDLAMRRAPVRASGLPVGWAAAALVVGLVAVIGASTFGRWQHGPAAAEPSATAAALRQAFTATGSMKEARQQASATLLRDGRVLVVGGNAVNNVATAPSAELYDPATGRFTLTGSPHVYGVPITSVLLKSGRVLVIGCDASVGCGSQLADVYDPSTGLFSAIGPITGGGSTGCEFCTATLLNDGRVLVARGVGSQPSLLYDPSTNAFAATGSMTTARIVDTATLLSDGRVLIVGGFDGTTTRPLTMSLASAELYDPETGTFSPTGSMTTPRVDQTATLLSDGRVLIAGGVDSTGDASAGKVLASAELYDPETGTFSPTGAMATARGIQTATLLSDGRVLIAGGSDFGVIAGGSASPGDVLEGNILASAELYDPKTGTFSPTGSMTTVRVDHTATLLSDGRVLIAGGADSSAELYQP